jgi:hypothetical protein
MRLNKAFAGLLAKRAFNLFTKENLHSGLQVPQLRAHSPSCIKRFFWGASWWIGASQQREDRGSLPSQIRTC